MTSKRPGRRGVSTSTARAPKIMATAIGTLIRNAARQEIHCVTAPPTRSPRLAPIPAVAPYQATARLRASPSKYAVISASEVGATMAAPMPCRARALMIHHPRCQADEQRRGAEDRQPDHEQPASADDVSGAGAEQEQSAEDERVRVLHPGQSGRCEIEVITDARQTGEDHRVVEQDHEIADQVIARIAAGFLLRGTSQSRHCLQAAGVTLVPGTASASLARTRRLPWGHGHHRPARRDPRVPQHPPRTHHPRAGRACPHTAATAASRGCAVKRSRCSPGCRSTTTSGWSAAAWPAPPRACSTPSPTRCTSTTPSATTSSPSPAQSGGAPRRTPHAARRPCGRRSSRSSTPSPTLPPGSATAATTSSR